MDSRATTDRKRITGTGNDRRQGLGMGANGEWGEPGSVNDRRPGKRQHHNHDGRPGARYQPSEQLLAGWISDASGRRRATPHRHQQPIQRATTMNHARTKIRTTQRRARASPKRQRTAPALALAPNNSGGGTQQARTSGDGQGPNHRGDWAVGTRPQPGEPLLARWIVGAVRRWQWNGERLPPGSPLPRGFYYIFVCSFSRVLYYGGVLFLFYLCIFSRTISYIVATTIHIYIIKIIYILNLS
jgi:hypothetical protein